MSERSFLVELDAGAGPLHGVMLEAHERVNAAYTYRVTVAHEDALDMDALIGTGASVAVPNGRTLRGIVTEVIAHDTGHTLTLAHSASLLEETRDYRVFVDEDAVSIATSIAGEHGLSLEAKLSETPPMRAQCVQQFESDLDFMRRVLAEEGVVMIADPASPTLVLTDHVGGYDDIEGEPVLAYGAGARAGLVGPESVHGARLCHKLVADKSTRRDRDAKKPLLDLTVAEGTGNLECYEYPGGDADADVGKRRSQVRLGQLARHRLVLQASSSCRRLAAGRVFELVDAPRSELNKRWLIIDMHVRASVDVAAAVDGARFVAELTAVPADTPYRPRVAAGPRARGVQHAVITGASEIHTEEHGRAKVKLRWDRRREADEHSSAWARVIQPAMSGGLFNPRTGWENLIGFGLDSHDAPITLGRLDNGASPPAESLPGSKVRSALGTPTTPGGGSSNVVMFDDTAGGLGMNLTASSDYNEKTEAAKKTSVAASDTLTVGGTLTESYKQSASVKIGGAQLQSVAGPRKVSSAAGIVEDAAAEVIAVGGARSLTIGGDLSTQAGASLSRTVGGAKIELALAGYEQHVSAVSTLAVGGALVEAGATASLTVGGVSLVSSASFSVLTGKYSEQALGLQESAASIAIKGTKVSYKAGGGMSLMFGSTSLTAPRVIFLATTTLAVNAGGARLFLTPGSVKVSGVFNAASPERGTGTVKHG